MFLHILPSMQLHDYRQFVFIPLLENEENSYNNIKLKSDEVLCRYMNWNKNNSNMMPLCILNRIKGTARFAKDLDVDPEELFERGLHFEYLRVSED